jgi:hypothetical protein
MISSLFNRPPSTALDVKRQSQRAILVHIGVFEKTMAYLFLVRPLCHAPFRPHWSFCYAAPEIHTKPATNLVIGQPTSTELPDSAAHDATVPLQPNHARRAVCAMAGGAIYASIRARA